VFLFLAAPQKMHGVLVFEVNILITAWFL